MSEPVDMVHHAQMTLALRDRRAVRIESRDWNTTAQITAPGCRLVGAHANLTGWLRALGFRPLPALGIWYRANVPARRPSWARRGSGARVWRLWLRALPTIERLRIRRAVLQLLAA